MLGRQAQGRGGHDMYDCDSSRFFQNDIFKTELFENDIFKNYLYEL